MSNVYEYEVEISGEELAAITELANAWGVQDDRWAYIHELVR